jgi:hypothetical protein
MNCRIFLLMLFWTSIGICADAPTTKKSVPRMPPPGIAVPPLVKAELESGVAALGKQIEELRTSLKSKPALLDLLPDVQIYHNAVRYALEDNIFYRTNEFADARKLLEEGRERARSLSEGQAPWNSATGLVVRGYVSKIDGSVQPYGLVVPATYQPGTTRKYRLDFWYHGRNGNLSELSFINERESKPGEFTPADSFVLHPYGRYCNANKFAGETDTFEAWENLKLHYPIDDNRVSVRGFSMGGAATWHMAGHHAGLWAAASPGAGFVDTAIFQKIFANTNHPAPPWYEQRLWHLYDVTDYAANLFNCPVVAYSGGIDPQKQAADLMTRAMANEGLVLVHVIGPNTGHSFEPNAKKEVARRVDALMETGRDPMPRKVWFTTWTLRYNQQAWVQVDGLAHHWERARVEAQILGLDTIEVTTTNVTVLTLSMPPDLCPFTASHRPRLVLDGHEIQVPEVAKDRSWTVHFEKEGARWTTVGNSRDEKLTKRHGLQGPIDDAFMESFIIVRPTGTPMNDRTGAWTETEMRSAIEQWRLQFRGEARVKNDVNITDADIASSNLILWGDPHSNRMLGRIASKLPLSWDADRVRLAGKTFSAANHVPVLIYPNPLNTAHYVVLNSGFTFADEAPTSNALQIPKLPDYAVRDVDRSGVVVDAGFFDEHWAPSLSK